MPSPSRSVLLLCRAAPYGDGRARDALDAAMAFGAFDQDITLLLLGDAVFMLRAGQQDRPSQARNLSRFAAALPDYGIGRIAVEAAALAERSIDVNSLLLPVAELDSAQIAALIAAHDVVLSL